MSDTITENITENITKQDLKNIDKTNDINKIDNIDNINNVKKSDDLIKDINLPILEKFEINSEPPAKIKLSSPVLCFNNLNEWIIIDLNIMARTPIIWTEVMTDNKLIPVSIVMCPRTLRASVFEGKLKSKYYKGDRLILENEEKSLIPIDMNIAIDDEYNLEINKRYQVYIQTLKNSLIDYYDIKYLHMTKKNKEYKYIIHKDYLFDKLDESGNKINLDLKFHPKTLVNLIQYISSKTNKKKITIIVGKDSNLLEIKGYDNKKSGFDEYILQYEEEIIKKESFIMPILYYKALQIYPNAKIIIL